jgi:hypothetical protein
VGAGHTGTTDGAVFPLLEGEGGEDAHPGGCDLDSVAPIAEVGQGIILVGTACGAAGATGCAVEIG